MKNNVINVFFVRHGETYFNFLKRYQGWADIDLTSRGIKEAKNVGQRLAKVHFKAAFSSDLNRAFKTGQIILNENESASADLVPSKDFREVFFGSAEGLNRKDFNRIFNLTRKSGDLDHGQLINKYGFMKLLDICKKNDPYHLAENSIEFKNRTNHGLIMIRETFKGGDNILVVTHGTYIRSLAVRFGNYKLAEDAIQNAAICKLILEPKKDGKTEIKVWNDTKKIW